MSTYQYFGREKIFARKEPISWSKTSGIVVDTWYDVTGLPNRPFRIWLFMFKHDNDDNTNRTLEVSLDINGSTWTDAQQDAVDNTYYYLYSNWANDQWTTGTTLITTGSLEADNAIPLVVNDLSQLQIRTTTAVGTNLKFYVSILYDELEDVM